MKTVQKRQIQIIMLLSAVILILLCGVLVTISQSEVTQAAEEEPYVHALLRDARPSANPALEYETTLGGSGNETPVSILTKNGHVYIFGNTDSHDYDFSANQAGKTQGFCAMLAENGRTEGFTVFPFTLEKVIPTGAGFAAAGNRGSVAGLFLLADDLTVTGEATMPAATPLSACGLYVFDNRFFLLAESLDTLTDRTSLLLQVYTSGLALERTKAFSHTYSLSLLDLLPTGTGYLLAAAASFQTSGFLTVARFDLLSEPAYTDVDLGYKYTPQAFAPLESGYAAVCDRDGKTELLTLTDTLQKNTVRFLSETSNTCRKSLFYVGTIYAHTGDELIQLDDSGKTLGSLAFPTQTIDAYLSDTVAAFCAGFAPDSQSLCLAFLGTAVQTRAVSVQGSAALLRKCGNRLLVCASVSGGKDAGKIFGGNDVWLASVQI